MTRDEDRALARKWPEPETYPGVVSCRGGWFAVQGKGELGSGPWKTREAADLALAGLVTGDLGYFDRARERDRLER
jgi:hypothetical protein